MHISLTSLSANLKNFARIYVQLRGGCFLCDDQTYTLADESV